VPTVGANMLAVVQLPPLSDVRSGCRKIKDSKRRSVVRSPTVQPFSSQYL
jgi:hypothetical protein